MGALASVASAVRSSFPDACGRFLDSLGSLQTQAVALKVFESVVPLFENQQGVSLNVLCQSNDGFRDKVRRDLFRELLRQKEFPEAEKVINTFSDPGYRTIAYARLGFDLGLEEKIGVFRGLQSLINDVFLIDDKKFASFFEVNQTLISLGVKAFNFAKNARYQDAGKLLSQIPNSLFKETVESMIALCEKTNREAWKPAIVLITLEFMVILLPFVWALCGR